tara:strand:+ start:5914 stop:6267 length:354 start_codon:yes stop_codon:yes gene_type:complete
LLQRFRALESDSILNPSLPGKPIIRFIGFPCFEAFQDQFAIIGYSESLTDVLLCGRQKCQQGSTGFCLQRHPVIIVYIAAVIGSKIQVLFIFKARGQKKKAQQKQSRSFFKGQRKLN